MHEELMTYVYDGREVYLTGRVAKNGPRSPDLLEIVPMGTTPGDKTYAKWVTMQDLYVIYNMENEEIDDEA